MSNGKVVIAGKPSLIEAAKMARDAADSILNGVKHRTSEEKYDSCACCGKPIPKFDGICEDCQLRALYEQESFQQRMQEAYERGEL